MSIMLLRRNKLGRGSCNGITANIPGSRVIRNWLPEELAAVAQATLLVRWGCTSTIPDGDYTVLNSARSIHWCSDKRAGRLAMQAAGVPVPETWTVEHFLLMSERDTDYNDDDFVLRRAQHAQGRDLWHGGMDETVASIRRHNVTGGYVSMLIPKIAEYRFFIAQGRVVWCARKTPGNPDDVAWNVARGGRFDNVRWDDWPLDAAKACIQAAIVSGTDFCGVDVMIDAEGQPYVLEVNSAPSQTSPYRQQCVARAFRYIAEHGKDIIPLPGTVKTYKGVRHPCLKEVA